MDVDNAPVGVLLFKDGRAPETTESEWLPLRRAFPIAQIGNPSGASIATDTDNDIS
jgi:hypothetical protein